MSTRHGTGSVGHRVNGSFGSSFTTVTGSSFLLGVRPEFFRFSKQMPKMQNVHLKCWNDESHCQVSVVGLKSLDVSPCNELLLLAMIIKNSHTPTHKSTFGVYYRTGSPGQLGLRVARFPGHWVAGSQNVTQFNVWCRLFGQTAIASIRSLLTWPQCASPGYLLEIIIADICLLVMVRV